MLLNDNDSFQFISQLPIISSCPFGYFDEKMIDVCQHKR